ncbi:MAG: AAA family ATPase [Ruminococcus sp.]
MQHCPELLILDEPTGGLDPLMQKEFFDILQERNQQGTTIFLSSHVLSEIQRNCTAQHLFVTAGSLPTTALTLFPKRMPNVSRFMDR